MDPINLKTTLYNKDAYLGKQNLIKFKTDKNIRGQLTGQYKFSNEIIDLMYFNITGIPEILSKYNISDEESYKLHILFGIDHFGLIGI